MIGLMTLVESFDFPSSSWWISIGWKGLMRYLKRWTLALRMAVPARILEKSRKL
jgi:hypothetical protein